MLELMVITMMDEKARKQTKSPVVASVCANYSMVGLNKN